MCCGPSSISHSAATDTYGLPATPSRSDFPLPPQPIAASRSFSFAPETRDQLPAVSAAAVPLMPVFRNRRREGRRDFMGHLYEKRLARGRQWSLYWDSAVRYTIPGCHVNDLPQCETLDSPVVGNGDGGAPRRQADHPLGQELPPHPRRQADQRRDRDSLPG